MSDTTETNEIAIVPQFDGIAFLSKIESADTLQKKVRIFNDALNQEPIMAKNMKEQLLKKGQSAGAMQDYDYIPIGVVEEALRQVFFRQVDFIIKNSYRDLNSFIVISTIKYKCPISQEYRRIDGIGAKALQQDAGAKIHDFNLTMKANALELGAPIAYSRSIKNAAKKLGELFGSALNRDDELENVLVFSEKVTDKDGFNLKLLKKLFEEKESKIASHDLETIQNVIDNKQTKAYKRFIDYLKKL